MTTDQGGTPRNRPLSGTGGCLAQKSQKLLCVPTRLSIIGLIFLLILILIFNFKKTPQIQQIKLVLCHFWIPAPAPVIKNKARRVDGCMVNAMPQAIGRCLSRTITETSQILPFTILSKTLFIFHSFTF